MSVVVAPIAALSELILGFGGGVLTPPIPKKPVWKSGKNTQKKLVTRQ